MAVGEYLEIAVWMCSQDPNEVWVHEGLSTQDAEEAVAMLLRAVDQLVHIVKADHFLWLVDIDPAALTPEVAAICDGYINERREGDALLQSPLKALDRTNSLVTEVVGKLPEHSFVYRSDCAVTQSSGCF